MNTIKSINPYSGALNKEYPEDDKESIRQKIKNMEAVAEQWADSFLEERIALLGKVSDLLEERKEDYALMMAEEMGKPIAQGRAEIDKCVWACDFYALNADDFLADDLIETDADESFISYDALGCVLAIMPWNYPFWQVIRFAAPTLTAGNTVLLKHAQNVPGCSKALHDLFIDAGYPKACFQALFIGHEEVNDLIGNPAVRAVTLTGSEKAGKAVAGMAGQHLKKTVLELGGNNACIVFEDADLDEHLETMVQARMQNTGQSCIAAKRFIVCEAIYDEFLKRFTSRVKALKAGDPSHEATEIGVLARTDLAETLQKQVKASIEMGAKVYLGNRVNDAFYAPTILTEVTKEMPVFKEETFGPVAAIIKADSREAAINLAVTSDYGLGTMLFTKDIDFAIDLIGKIPDGSFFINEMVKSDPRLPFGGTKASGYGRELSKEGMLEFVNKKTVYIKKHPKS